MEIVRFERRHMEEARALAFANYCEERQAVADLPKMDDVPDLDEFAENGLGVAAFEGGRMLGFLCYLAPWENAFGSSVAGTFSPIHAHGAVADKRALIYRRMYQCAADILVKKRILYHTIALYEHDTDAIRAWFDNGFGHRCADAIRKVEEIGGIVPAEGITYEEIPPQEAFLVRELRRKLSEHMGESSCFMYTKADRFEEWVKQRESNGDRIFVAREEEKIIAFMELSDSAETFVTEHPSMKNICGAYCLPEYRGKNIFQNLLNYVILILNHERTLYLGVDYESMNPTAYYFWRKYFKPYTCSVTRRIDGGEDRC